MQLDFHWLVEDEYEAFILTFLAFILILLSPYKAIQNAFNVFHRFGRYFAPVLVLLLMVMLFFFSLIHFTFVCTFGVINRSAMCMMCVFFSGFFSSSINSTVRKYQNHGRGHKRDFNPFQSSC